MAATEMFKLRSSSPFVSSLKEPRMEISAMVIASVA